MSEDKKFEVDNRKFEWLAGNHSSAIIGGFNNVQRNIVFSVKGGTLTLNLDMSDITVSEGVDFTDAAKGFLNACAKLLCKPALFPED